MSRFELLLALDRLDDLVHGAPDAPFSDQAMVARKELAALAEKLSVPPGADVDRALSEHLRQLQALLAAAKPVPLTGRARIDRAAVVEVCDKIRDAVVGPPTAVTRFLGAVDALQDEVTLGRAVDRDTLAALAAQVTVPRQADLGMAAERRPALLEHVRELQALVAAAKPTRFSDRVRADSEALAKICRSIRAEILSPDES